jgi:hypothetical protein
MAYPGPSPPILVPRDVALGDICPAPYISVKARHVAMDSAFPRGFDKPDHIDDRQDCANSFWLWRVGLDAHLTTRIQQMARRLQCRVCGALVSSKPCLEKMSFSDQSPLLQRCKQPWTL